MQIDKEILTYEVSTDRNRLDLPTIYRFLAQAYWSTKRPKELIDLSIANSLCFGIYTADQQVGFARVITDFATHAYICDVFVDEAFRGKGAGKQLIAFLLDYPDLQPIPFISLATRDAHDFYRLFGFEIPERLTKWMEFHR